jgi:hypothetical protein
VYIVIDVDLRLIIDGLVSIDMRCSKVLKANYSFIRMHVWPSVTQVQGLLIFCFQTMTKLYFGHTYDKGFLGVKILWFPALGGIHGKKRDILLQVLSTRWSPYLSTGLILLSFHLAIQRAGKYMGKDLLRSPSIRSFVFEHESPPRSGRERLK